MTDMVKMAKRQAMLDAQTRWTDEAERAETLTLRTVATLIADTFRQEAELYKEDLSTRTDGGWSDDNFTGSPEHGWRSNGDDERGAPLVLLEEG